MPALYRAPALHPAPAGNGRTRAATHGRRVALAAAAAAAAAGLLAGCGSSTTSGSGANTPSTAETPAVCTQAAALASSLKQLTSVDIVQQGTNALNAAAENVQTQFQNLSQTAGSQYQDTGSCEEAFRSRSTVARLDIGLSLRKSPTQQPI